MQLGSESTTRRPARLVLYVTGRSSCAHTWRVSGCTFTMMTRLPISGEHRMVDAHDLHRWPGAGVNSTRSAGPASPFLAVLQDASPAPGIVASGDTGPALGLLVSSALAVAAAHRRFRRCGISLAAPAFPLAFNLAALAALTCRRLGRPAPRDERLVRGQHHIDQTKPGGIVTVAGSLRRRHQAGQPIGQGSVGQAVAVVGLDQHRPLLLGQHGRQDAARNLVHGHAAPRRVEVRAIARRRDKRPVQVNRVELECALSGPPARPRTTRARMSPATGWELAALAPWAPRPAPPRGRPMFRSMTRLAASSSAMHPKFVPPFSFQMIARIGRRPARLPPVAGAHDSARRFHHGRNGRSQQTVTVCRQLGQQLAAGAFPVLARLGWLFASFANRLTCSWSPPARPKPGPPSSVNSPVDRSGLRVAGRVKPRRK